MELQFWLRRKSEQQVSPHLVRHELHREIFWCHFPRDRKHVTVLAWRHSSSAWWGSSLDFRAKQSQVNLEKRKFMVRAQFSTLLIWNCMWLGVFMKKKQLFLTAESLWCRAVIFNLFHAATHFATQFNLTTPFRKFLSQAYKMQLCLHNRKWQKITHDITTLNKDSFFKFMLMAASVRETRAVCKSLHSIGGGTGEPRGSRPTHCYFWGGPSPLLNFEFWLNKFK